MTMYYDPANPKNKYWTALGSTDPGIPTGYLDSQSTDGGTPEKLKTYSAGINSGGYPAYQGDSTAPTGSNGRLS